MTSAVQVALRWLYAHSLVRERGLTKEHIDRIPGKVNDRKTPLGELNWIFTAVTDTIAWNLLPRALFQRLFRQVLLELLPAAGVRALSGRAAGLGMPPIPCRLPAIAACMQLPPPWPVLMAWCRT